MWYSRVINFWGTSGLKSIWVIPRNSNCFWSIIHIHLPIPSYNSRRCMPGNLNTFFMHRKPSSHLALKHICAPTTHLTTYKQYWIDVLLKEIELQQSFTGSVTFNFMNTLLACYTKCPALSTYLTEAQRVWFIVTEPQSLSLSNIFSIYLTVLYFATSYIYTNILPVQVSLDSFGVAQL